jgi:hypothetical protein
MIKSYPFLTVQQNQHLSVLQARAKARAEYKKQGICTDLFYDLSEGNETELRRKVSERYCLQCSQVQSATKSS